MSAHEWHVLLAFSGLSLALGVWEPKAALVIVGVAATVVLVTNAGEINKLLP